MSASTAVVAFAAALLLCGPASARSLFLLYAPTYACAEPGAAESLALGSPRRSEAEIARKGCLRLSGSYYVDDSLHGYVCLRLSRGSCLWVPNRAGSSSLDDGVF